MSDAAELPIERKALREVNRRKSGIAIMSTLDISLSIVEPGWLRR
jgi:hypothetical protein